MLSDRPVSPLWLSHHHDHERCVRIGSHDVCRRCAVLYPLIVLAAACTLALDLPSGTAIALMWLLPAPMSLDWVLEQTGRVSPSPRRLVLVSSLAALGIGAALAAHLRQPFDPDAVAPMATHFTVCAVASILVARQRSRVVEVGGISGVSDWERQHARSESTRNAELRALLARDDRESLGTE